MLLQSLFCISVTRVDKFVLLNFRKNLLADLHRQCQFANFISKIEIVPNFLFLLNPFVN